MKATQNRGLFLSIHTCAKTQQKIMELKGRPLALSSPRESKQMNEVWEHLPPPAMPCHQPCVRSSVMTCGEPPQELPLPAAPSLLSCESFHAVLRALRASAPYAMRTNSLAIMMALLLLRGVKTATAQGEPLTSSLCQAQSWVILHGSFCPLPQLPFSEMRVTLTKACY